MGEVWDAVL